MNNCLAALFLVLSGIAMIIGKPILAIYLLLAPYIYKELEK